MQIGPCIVIIIWKDIESNHNLFSIYQPRRQLVLTLRGCLEFKSCDVDEEDAEHKVTIRRGDILLAEDLEGAGHVWKFVESSDGNFYPWIRCYIHLGEEYDHFVSQLIPI